MPRVPRSALVYEDSYNHCTWRSHDLAFVLETPEAKSRFLSLLGEYKTQYGIRIISYCVMSNHPHVVVRCTKGQVAFSAFWKVVNQRFARWYNRRAAKRGQVVMERLASPLIQDGRHLLVAMRYGDLNPVRAGIVRRPKDFRWSSYRHYALGERNDLIDDDGPEYLALGRTAALRRKAYVHLFAVRASATIRSRRPDLVTAPFIGDESWVRAKLEERSQAPPQ